MMQSNLLRQLDIGVHDSGGRYPRALELAPDLPRDLLRYDSLKDPYRDMYRTKEQQRVSALRQERLRQEQLQLQQEQEQQQQLQQQPQPSDMSLMTKRSDAPSVAVPDSQRDRDQPTVTGFKGKFARGLQSLFTHSDSSQPQHARTRSAGDAQAGSPPVAPVAPMANLAAVAPAAPSPAPSIPPPLPPKPSFRNTTTTNDAAVAAAAVAGGISPPVPPPPALGPARRVLSAVVPNSNEQDGLNRTWNQQQQQHPPPPAPPGPKPNTDTFITTPSNPMSRAEQWTQALKGQEFEVEDGLFGPYDTGSAVGANFPPIMSIEEMRKKRDSELTKDSRSRDSPRRTDKGTPHRVPVSSESVDSSPSKVSSHVRAALNQKSRSKDKERSKTPKASKASRASEESIALNEAKRTSRNSSEHYENPETAHAAALARLVAVKGVQASRGQAEMGHQRHHTLDTDLTHSTASFGHILHSNGRPIPVNMQTQSGLLPSRMPPNSNTSRLGDISEQSEPLSRRWQGSSEIPMTGEAAKYYAQVETVSDADELKQPQYTPPPQTPVYAPQAPISAQHALQLDVLSQTPQTPIYSQAQTRRDSSEGRFQSAHHLDSRMSPQLSAAFGGAEAALQHSLNMLALDRMAPPAPQGVSPTEPPRAFDGVPSVLQAQTPSYRNDHPITPSYVPTPYNPTIASPQPTGTPASALHATPSRQLTGSPHSSVFPDAPSTLASLSHAALSKGNSISGLSTASPSVASGPSVATAMVPQMVQRSSFHDETLCQLLDASRLNLLGDEAKKALMRAARARVVELKDIREKTKEMEKGVTRTEPLHIKKKHHKRSGKHSPEPSDSDTEGPRKAESAVEELIEHLLEKQDVDQATKEHVCKDPANHSRCLSDDGEFEKVEEDLYRGRITPNRDYRGTGGPPSGPQFPPAPYIPGYPPYQFMPPQPYPVYLQQPIYQGYPQPAVQVQVQTHPGMPAQQPVQPPRPQPQPQQQPYLQPQTRSLGDHTAPDTDVDSAPFGSPNPNLDYRVPSRDSRELMAEVLNIEYAGIPVKQILQEFLLERQDSNVRPASIHTIHTATPTPEARQVDPLSPQSRGAVSPPPTPQAEAPHSPPLETPRTTRAGTPRQATPAQSPRVQSPRPPSTTHSHVHSQSQSHKAPSTRAPTSPPARQSVHSRASSQQSIHERERSVHSHRDVPRDAVSDKDSKAATSVDWAWGPEIKIRVQPPTTLSHTASGSLERERPPSPRAAPPPSIPMSPATTYSNIDYTASYLPMDVYRDLPPLPPSTYAPSAIGTVRSPGGISESPSYPPKMAPAFKGTPWELVAHRLYSWALVWEDDYFSRALESISIGRPVDEFPLTVVSMMMFKRILQLRMSATPPQVCDKLFVPPNIAEAINKAVHAKQYEDAQALLEGLWDAFGLTEPPRVIISLVRHGAVKNSWIANRYDLVTHRFASYIVGTSMPTQKEWDGRPFMWWHPIRQAWPNYSIPDPIALTQVVKPINVPIEFTEDISLRAASIARNLLLGIRPEHDHDIPKLRKQAWTEVNRLHTKKKAGRLMMIHG